MPEYDDHNEFVDDLLDRELGQDPTPRERDGLFELLTGAKCPINPYDFDEDFDCPLIHGLDYNLNDPEFVTLIGKLRKRGFLDDRHVRRLGA